MKAGMDDEKIPSMNSTYFRLRHGGNAEVKWYWADVTEWTLCSIHFHRDIDLLHWLTEQCHISVI